MPTVEKKYTEDVSEGRGDYQGNHDVYEMPDRNKPRIRWSRPNSRVIITTLLLLLFIAGISVVIYEIMKRSQGFA